MSTPTVETTTALVIAEPVIEGQVFEGTIPTPEPEPEVPMSDEARIAALKAIWAKGTEDENNALFSLGAARVLKARAAYMAGALGSKTGTPNNKAAMRVLDLAQNTVRPYFLAGVALAEAGWDGSILAPTEAEIAIVNPIISKAQKGGTKVKSEPTPKGTEGTGAGTGDGDEGTGEGVGNTTPKGTDEPVIQADVIAAVEALQTVVGRFTRDHGFSGVVADNLSEVLMEIANTIEAHRVDGGDV